MSLSLTAEDVEGMVKVLQKNISANQRRASQGKKKCGGTGGQNLNSMGVTTAPPASVGAMMGATMGLPINPLGGAGHVTELSSDSSDEEEDQEDLWGDSLLGDAHSSSSQGAEQVGRKRKGGPEGGKERKPPKRERVTWTQEEVSGRNIIAKSMPFAK